MQGNALGIGIMLVATSMTNVGAVVQKKAVDALPPFEGRPLAASVRAVLRSPLWVAGWLSGLVAIVLNMVALGLADLSVVQPLNGFGLVVLAVASRLLLGERLGPVALAGTALVVAGVALVGATALPSRVFADASELLGCYARPPAVAAVAVAVALLFAAREAARRRPAHAGVIWAFVAAACSVLGLTFSKGLFGLFATVGLLPALALWPAWVLAALVIAGSTAAMAFQQLSFQKGRATVVTPVFAASSVVLPLLTGRLVFDERLAGSSALAVLLIVAGVVLLGARGEAPPHAAVAGS